MTALQTAAQQALEALEKLVVGSEYEEAVEAERAMDALRSALAEPVQEPVAYWNTDESSLAFNPKRSGMWVPLYADPKPCPTCVSLARTVMMDQTGYDTAPPQRKPLTEEEIEALDLPPSGTLVTVRDFVRLIERAHGIGGQQ